MLCKQHVPWLCVQSACVVLGFDFCFAFRQAPDGRRYVSESRNAGENPAIGAEIQSVARAS